MRHRRGLESPTNQTASLPTAIEVVVDATTSGTDAPELLPVAQIELRHPVVASEPDGIPVDCDRRRGSDALREQLGAFPFPGRSA